MFSWDQKDFFKHNTVTSEKPKQVHRGMISFSQVASKRPWTQSLHILSDMLLSAQGALKGSDMAPNHNDHETLILKTQGFLNRYQVPIGFTINSHLQEFYIQSWKCWNVEKSWFSREKKIQGNLLFRRRLLFQFSCLFQFGGVGGSVPGFLRWMPWCVSRCIQRIGNVRPSFSGTKICSSWGKVKSS